MIEALHELMATLPDPKHTQVVAQCLQNLTRVQSEMMSQGGGGGPQGPPQGGPPPGMGMAGMGGPGAAPQDPRQALMAQLGG